MCVVYHTVNASEVVAELPEIAREKISWAKAADAYSTPEVCQKLAMLLSTGSNAAAYFAFHFSAETKRMHQAIRHSPDVPASL